MTAPPNVSCEASAMSPLFVLGTAISSSATDIPDALMASVERFVPRARLRRLDAYALTALSAGCLALEQASEVLSHFPRLGLVLATGLGPLGATCAFMDSLIDYGPLGASPTAFAHTVHNVAASTLSILLDIQGPALTVSQNALAATSALLTARTMLLEGRADAILLGAIEDAHPVIAAMLEAVADDLPPPLAPRPEAAFMLLSLGRDAVLPLVRMPSGRIAGDKVREATEITPSGRVPLGYITGIRFERLESAPPSGHASGCVDAMSRILRACAGTARSTPHACMEYGLDSLTGIVDVKPYSASRRIGEAQ